MKKYIIIMLLVAGMMAFRKGIDNGNTQTAIKNAISKSLPLLQSSSHAFLVNAITCHSCHNQGIGLVAFSMAREKGFPVSDSIFHEAVDSTCRYWATVGCRQTFAENDDPVAIVMTGNYDLWGLSASHYAGNKMIMQLTQNIMRKQSYDGRWVSPGQRPPLEYYDISATALTVKNIQVYTAPILHTEVERRVAKARAWLSQAVPEANEEKAFRLLGLTWAHASEILIAQQAKQLLAAQRADGGWGQLDSLPSDAYATGQALYALQQSGQLTTKTVAYQKGVTFLLSTQFDDGSWKVITRSYPFVPYVASGFPHGHNEFISAAGSNWATIALLLANENF